jgi:uroporphyrinogen decarboxylase
MTDFPSLKNDRLIRAAFGEPVEQLPVWMMRQAGRYLPEYRKVRDKHEFFTVCQTPELATKVTLQPVERFPVDGAIIFSDILVIPQALGLEVEMVSGKGPHFPDPLREPVDLNRLQPPEVDEKLDYVFEALTMTRKELGGRVPLIGFSGAPWTLMAYMIEGGGSKYFAHSKRWLFDRPDAATNLLERITDAVVDYLIGQVRAGAQVLQVFDSWAGILDPETFNTLVFPHLEQLARRVKRACPEVPLIAFARGSHYAIESLAATAFDVLSVDWTVAPSTVRKRVGDRTALQGNLDPCVLYAAPGVIREHVREMIDGFGTRAYIANLGHGMHPDHDPAHAGAFIDAVHDYTVTTELHSTKL